MEAESGTIDNPNCQDSGDGNNQMTVWPSASASGGKIVWYPAAGCSQTFAVRPGFVSLETIRYMTGGYQGVQCGHFEIAGAFVGSSQPTCATYATWIVAPLTVSFRGGSSYQIIWRTDQGTPSWANADLDYHTGTTTSPRCSDGADNDGDGTVDYPGDRGCSNSSDDSEHPDHPECSDGRDNDVDGRTDFPSDPGCTSGPDDSENSAISPQCSDGRDNDFDETTDYPNDSDCASTSDDTESAHPPQCSDGTDNDLDRATDYPADPGCSGSTDNSESPDPPQCSDGRDNDGDGQSDYPADLGCSNSTDVTESPNPQCSDGVDNDGDGWTDSSADPGCLSQSDTTENPNPQCSDGMDNDGDGRTDHPADPGCTGVSDTSESPDPPQCSDGLDNEGDGRTDYPSDPGCTDVADNGESPDPQCGDRVDNDADGRIDHPADTGCTALSDDSESPDPQCSDQVDNDLDGRADYPDDGGCWGVMDDSEAPNSQCSDGVDNDLDMTIDHPQDPDCTSPQDDTEGQRCWDGMDNDHDGLIDVLDPGCSGTADDDEGYGPGSAPPRGRLCGFDSVADPNGEDESQVGEVHGGPLVTDVAGASIQVTCTIQVGGANATHAGVDADFVTSTVGTQVASIPPTEDDQPPLINYVSPENTPVFLCTEAIVNGTSWYWDATIAVEGPVDQLDTATGWTTSNNALCNEAVSQEVWPGPAGDFLCTFLPALAPGDPTGVVYVGPDGDLDVAGTGVLDCYPEDDPGLLTVSLMLTA